MPFNHVILNFSCGKLEAKLLGDGLQPPKKFCVKLLGWSLDDLLNRTGCFGGAERAIFQVKWVKSRNCGFFASFGGC